MRRCGGAIRHTENLENTLKETVAALRQLEKNTGVKDCQSLYKAYQYRDALICQSVCLSAMLHFRKTAEGTRGSALYTDPNGEKRGELEEIFRFVSMPRTQSRHIQQGTWTEGSCNLFWREVRPLPEKEDVFETVWRGFRQNKNIDYGGSAMENMGLVSVSFRNLTPEEVIRAAVDAGLRVIEWGSDVHAPKDKKDRLEEIVQLQERYGIRCCSYGTYFYL